MTIKTSIVIPNWNGCKLLEKNLPSVIASQPDEIVIVDNGSKDNSVDFLENKYPNIRLIKNYENLGFAIGCNQGVKAARGEYVVLLNNDVVPEKDFLIKSLPNFEDSKVFAISFNEPQWSWARIYWKHGYIEHEPGQKDTKTHFSAWASGGSSFFRKSIWDELDGFDPVYHPFYWEDIDLSYRAWKRGYRILWEPKAIVYHKHESTIGKNFSKDFINYISERNRLIFIWKNITDDSLFQDHKKFLLKRICTQPKYLRVFLSMISKLNRVYDKRQIEKQNCKITDEEIFKYFEKN